eukprot:scaffold4542_cov71-Phaeocystis_antarctica.AAC.2
MRFPEAGSRVPDGVTATNAFPLASKQLASNAGQPTARKQRYVCQNQARWITETARSSSAWSARRGGSNGAHRAASVAGEEGDKVGLERLRSA